MTEVRPTRTLIEDKRVIKYVIVLGKGNRNGKGALKATRSMGKGLHKVFSTVVKYILQELRALGESGSEVSHFIPEPRNFAEVKKNS